MEKYYGKVTSEVALVYKINAELISSQMKATDYENKRVKWRASRVRDISKVFEK